MHSKLTAVISSNVVGYGYNPVTKELFIEFKNGHIFRYKDVPESVVEDFSHAPSIGRFFNANIKNDFDTIEVTADEVDEGLPGAPPRKLAPKPRKRRRPTLDASAYPWLRTAVI